MRRAQLLKVSYRYKNFGCVQAVSNLNIELEQG